MEQKEEPVAVEDLQEEEEDLFNLRRKPNDCKNLLTNISTSLTNYMESTLS